MPVLVIAEHDGALIKDSTLNTVTAANELDTDVHLLVAGSDCRGAADTAAKIAGGTKVLVVDDARYAHQLAGTMGMLIASLASNYSHVLAPATTTGKNYMPRAAALLDRCGGLHEGDGEQ